VAGDEPSELVLETRSGGALRVTQERGDASRVVAEAPEGGAVEVTGDPQVVDDALQAGVGEAALKIEDRAGGAGDGNAVAAADVLAGQSARAVGG
jgi:hypothetical protein